MFWQVDDHAIRKLMDVPPLLQTLGQKYGANESSGLAQTDPLHGDAVEVQHDGEDDDQPAVAVEVEED